MYEIRHPDQAMPLRSGVVVGVGGDGNTPDRAEHIALIRVVRMEEMDDGDARQAG